MKPTSGGGGGGWEEKEGLHVFLEPLSLSCVFGGVSAN